MKVGGLGVCQLRHRLASVQADLADGTGRSADPQGRGDMVAVLPLPMVHSVGTKPTGCEEHNCTTVLIFHFNIYIYWAIRFWLRQYCMPVLLIYLLFSILACLLLFPIKVKEEKSLPRESVLKTTWMQKLEIVWIYQPDTTFSFSSLNDYKRSLSQHWGCCNARQEPSGAKNSLLGIRCMIRSLSCFTSYWKQN